VTYTQDELVNLLKNKAKINDIVEFIDFQPGERGNSGRLHQLGILYKTKDGHEKSFRINSQYKIRNALHEKFLFSSAFIWDYEKDASGKMTKIILQGAGWGHGAGLCQMGALGMALKGYSYEDILKLYYDKTELVKAY
jgi:stage II sporulation protein D